MGQPVAVVRTGDAMPGRLVNGALPRHTDRSELKARVEAYAGTKQQ